MKNIFRLVVVSGASYADCDGVYTMTNMSSVWDSKHIVYTRIAGGEDPNTEPRSYQNSKNRIQVLENWIS